MSIITSKPSKTAQSLSRLLDKPTKEIERFLDTFRNVPQARKKPLPTQPKSNSFDFYEGWLPILISDISSEDNGDIVLDVYIAFENLGSDDFTNLLLTLDPKGFNRLTRAIASI